MSFTVEIKASPKENSLVVINTETAEILNLTNKKVSYIAFGATKCYVEVKISDQLGDDIIQLSNDVIEHLKTPKYLRYEMKHDEGGIILGPAIGYLMSKSKKEITQKELHKTLAYVSHYSLLNGAVIVFSLDCVNKENHTINGYCYNPKNNSWEEGVFPYPSAIYRRLGLNESWRNHFLSVIGDNFFYNYRFDKWKMYQWFCNDNEMTKYFPETILYDSGNDIQTMLNKYDRIYAKPIGSSGGKGIIHISKEDGKIIYKNRSGKKNQRLSFDTMNSAKAYGANLFKEKEYILQQPIDLMRCQGNIFDIRCMMLRDHNIKWECSGIVGRVASKGSVVSNSHSGGTPTKIDILFKNYLGYSESQYDEIKKELENVSIKAAQYLDNYGIKAAVLGIDIGIDTSGKLWIIEINIRYPGLDLFTFLGDYHMVDKTKTGVMLYGKYLAGFGPEVFQI